MVNTFRNDSLAIKQPLSWHQVFDAIRDFALADIAPEKEFVFRK